MNSEATKLCELKPNSGIRLQDCEYSTEYIAALRAWMKDSNNADFEKNLIDSGLISFEIKSAELGYDFIIESLPPPEELAFESGSIRFVELDPDDQLNKRFRNELLRAEKREKWVKALGLSNQDINQVTMASQNIENFFGSISYAPKVLKLTEQPSADMLRNRPPNLRISHLRRLREDGYFEFEEPDVQKAAYFISKLIWEEAELSSFCDIITWERFCKAKPRVDKIIRKTWPERFNRIKIALKKLTDKQYDAFEYQYDIDIYPTIPQCAKKFKIDPSSFKERTSRVRQRMKKAFPEFAQIKKMSKAWSKVYDLQLSGFYRKSYEFFRKATWTRVITGEKILVSESLYGKTGLKARSVNLDVVRAWLKLRAYQPDARMVMNPAKYSGNKIGKGEFFHHKKAWRESNLRSPLVDPCKFKNKEIDQIVAYQSRTFHDMMKSKHIPFVLELDQ